MLSIKLPENEDNEAVELRLEHSLVSLSKWEEIYEKPFFSREEKTVEETLAYITAMLLDDSVSEETLKRLNAENYVEITNYINAKRSATWFNNSGPSGGAQEAITSELVYYWLVQFKIPFHPTETWHLNRLMTLVKIAGVKQTKPKKMSKSEQAQKYRDLNAQRRAQLGTAG